MGLFQAVAGGNPGPASPSNYSLGDVWRHLTRERFNGTDWVGQPRETVTPLVPDTTVSIDPSLGEHFTLLANQDATVAVGTVLPGQSLYIGVLTGTTQSFSLTFGDRFRTTGALATVSVAARLFQMHFAADGSTYNEVSRTAGMA